MGDWRLFFHTRDRLKLVKAADVTRVAKAYLLPANRTLGMFLPTKAPERPPAPARVDVAALMKDFKSEGSTVRGRGLRRQHRHRREAHPAAGAAGRARAGLPAQEDQGRRRARGADRALRQREGAEGPDGGGERGAEHADAREQEAQLPAAQGRARPPQGRGAASGAGASRSRPRARSGSASRRCGRTCPRCSTLVSEVLREPAFPAAEWETLRKESLARLEEELQDPMSNGFRDAAAEGVPPAQGGRALPAHACRRASTT